MLFRSDSTRTGTGRSAAVTQARRVEREEQPQCPLLRRHTDLSSVSTPTRRNHVYAITTNVGEIIDTKSFPTSNSGINRAMNWVARRTDDSPEILWVIEGAASYGALLTAAVTTCGSRVAEAPQIGRHLAAGKGKTDTLDAQRIAVATLPVDETRLRTPRTHDGIRAAVRVLVTARDAMSEERTRDINALTALLRTHELGIDARRRLTNTQIHQVGCWRSRNEPLVQAPARTEAMRLARRVTALDAELADNLVELTELLQVSQGAALLAQPGFGPVATAICLMACRITVGFAQRPRSLRWQGSIPFQPHRATRFATDSIEVATVGSTRRCTWWR